MKDPNTLLWPSRWLDGPATGHCRSEGGNILELYRNTGVKTQQFIQGLPKSSRIVQQKSASSPFFLLVFRLSLITDADSYSDLDSKSGEI